MPRSSIVKPKSPAETAQFFLPLYLGLGIGRTIRRVHEIVRQVGVRVSLKTLERYSRDYGWVEAAREFDAKRADEIQHVAIDQIMSNKARQAQLGRLQQETVIQAIANWVKNPTAQSFSGMAAMADSGVRNERLAAGEATEIREVLIGVYQVFLVEAANLWMAGQRAQQAVYEAAGIVDAGLHARAHNAAGEVFGPGMDALVRGNFTQLGIADVVFGDDPAIEERKDE